MKAILPLLRAATLAATLGACAADQPQLAQAGPPAYCPAVPEIPVNAQGLVLPPVAITGGANDWESVFAYNLEQTLSTPSRLAGKPAATARDLAELEMLGNSFDRNIRFQTLPSFGLLFMRTGRAEFRDTMGISQETPAPVVARALLATECALSAGDRAAARAALARVAQAPDALDLIAPPGGNAPPRIPVATAAAAGNAARAIREQGRGGGIFFRPSSLGW